LSTERGTLSVDKNRELKESDDEVIVTDGGREESSCLCAPVEM
jgi:hypothetical protein